MNIPWIIIVVMVFCGCSRFVSSQDAGAVHKSDPYFHNPQYPEYPSLTPQQNNGALQEHSPLISNPQFPDNKHLTSDQSNGAFQEQKHYISFPPFPGSKTSTSQQNNGAFHDQRHYNSNPQFPDSKSLTSQQNNGAFQEQRSDIRNRQFLDSKTIVGISQYDINKRQWGNPIIYADKIQQQSPGTGTYNGRNNFSGTNHYMDTVLLANLPKIVLNAKQDPLALKDFKAELKQKGTLINLKVKTEYDQGSLSGLSRAKRAAECSPVLLQDKEERMNCILAFDDLNVKYHGRTKKGRLPKTNINVIAKVNRVLVNVMMAAHGTGSTPYVKSINISNNISFEPVFSGLGVTTPSVKDLEDGFSSQVKEMVGSALQNEFRSSLQEAIRNIHFTR